MIAIQEVSSRSSLWQPKFSRFYCFQTQINKYDVHKYLWENLFYRTSKSLQVKFVTFSLPLFIRVTNLFDLERYLIECSSILIMIITFVDKKLITVKKIINEDKVSHKGKKLSYYLAEMKLEAVKYDDINGNRAAERICECEKIEIK